MAPNHYRIAKNARNQGIRRADIYRYTVSHLDLVNRGHTLPPMSPNRSYDPTRRLRGSVAIEYK